MSNKLTKTGVSIHWIDDDEPRLVAAISQSCFGPDAWSEDKVCAFMERSDHIPKVLTVGSKAAGFNFYVLHDKVVFIRHFGVTPEFRRQGFGTQMVEALKINLKQLRRRIIAVEVPEDSLAGQVMFRECGFKWFRTTPSGYAMRYVAPRRRRP